VQDLDWFFWMLPKLYGKLGTQARDVARKARAMPDNTIRTGKVSKRTRVWVAAIRTFYQKAEGSCLCRIEIKDRPLYENAHGP
jgi:hypothetical protein